MAFCYIQTNKNDPDRAGSKQKVLESFLYKLKARGIHPEYVLTDKDWSEINAMGAVWPWAKHQLCFWHALRALQQRLANRSTSFGTGPGSHDVHQAAMLDHLQLGLQSRMAHVRRIRPTKPRYCILIVLADTQQAHSHSGCRSASEIQQWLTPPSL